MGKGSAMSDEVDQTTERMERESELRRFYQPFALEPGEAGECQLCGEQSARLVRGACAPCRDKRKLP